MHYTFLILTFLTFSVCVPVRAETPVEAALHAFLSAPPSPTTVVIWSTASGSLLKAGGKATLGLSGLANPGYKVLLDEKEVPTHLNGSFFLRILLEQKSTRHKLEFIHPTQGSFKYAFDASFIGDERNQDHLELSWRHSAGTFFPSGWFNCFRLGLLIVSPDPRHTGYSTEVAWVPNLLQITDSLSVRASISASILTYIKDKRFFLLDSGILFSLKLAPWTFEIGPSFQTWTGYQPYQPAVSANVLYGFDKPVLYVLDKIYLGYSYYLIRGEKAHEGKLGVELVF